MDNFYELFIRGKLNWSSREVIAIIIILTTTAVILFVLVGGKGREENGENVNIQTNYGKICVRQAIAIYFLIVFLCLIYSYCIFSRLPQGEPMYNLELFWSWKRAFKVLKDTNEDVLRIYFPLKEGVSGSDIVGTIGAVGSPSYLLVEIILNFMLLIPIGFLVPFIMPDTIVMEERIARKSVNRNRNRQTSKQLHQLSISRTYFIVIIVSLVCALCISFSIELLQMFTQRGLFEWDDIIGNVIGGVIGGIIGMMVRIIWRKCRKSAGR